MVAWNAWSLKVEMDDFPPRELDVLDCLEDEDEPTWDGVSATSFTVLSLSDAFDWLSELATKGWILLPAFIIFFVVG